MKVSIRKESVRDLAAIRQVVSAAFADHPHSNQTEHLLVDRLRERGTLSISLIAEYNDRVVGHIAFSPVTIDGKACNWYGLGPVSVLPELQGQGVGSKLVQSGISLLRELGAKGCVLLGEPAYYHRFGFRVRDGLTLAGVPPEYFLALPFTEEEVTGEVVYDKAFEICG